jgi:hypothetical protein
MIDIPTISINEFISTLKKYQADQIAAAVGNGTEHELEAAARAWVSAAGATDTIPFGGAPPTQPFFDALMTELTAFLCGTTDVYDAERKQLEKIIKPSESNASRNKTIAVYIAGAIAAKLGVVAALLIPPIGLLLLLIGKMGIRAWCTSRGCPID